MFRPLLIWSILTLSAIAQAADTSTQEAQKIGKGITFALQMYQVDCNEFPTTEQGLNALKVQPKEGCKNWGPDPYLNEIPTDPWHHAWRYKRIDKKHFQLWSLGADDQKGGTHDAEDIYLDDKI